MTAQDERPDVPKAFRDAMKPKRQKWLACSECGDVWNPLDKYAALSHDITHPRGFESMSIDPPEPVLTARAASDLRWGPPPKPLLPPFMTTCGALVLYGPGGVGKGTVACHLILEYVRETGRRVLILDYEDHENEWGNRLRGMGATDEELQDLIKYACPYSEDWAGDRGSLLQASDDVRDLCDALDIGLVVVDSIVMASDGDAAMGGASAAKDYFKALAKIGRPSISLAHVANGQARFPARPFGSSYVHNLARETWAMERNGEEEDGFEYDRVVTDLTSTFQVELRNRKNSEGERQRPVTFDITYSANGSIDMRMSEKASPLRDQIKSVLRGEPGLTNAQIAKAIKEEEGDAYSAKAITNCLQRNKGDFEVDGKKWSLA